VLDGVVVAGLVGILRQVSNLAEFVILLLFSIKKVIVLLIQLK
jgi:hypothetical protein